MGFKLTYNDRMTFILVLLRKKATENGIKDLFFTLINQKHFNVEEIVLFFSGCAKMLHSYQMRSKGMSDALILSSHKQYIQQKYNSLFSQKKHIQLIQWLACVKWLDTNKTDGKLRKYYEIGKWHCYCSTRTELNDHLTKAFTVTNKFLSKQIVFLKISVHF